MAALETSRASTAGPPGLKGIKFSRSGPKEAGSFIFLDQNAIAAKQSYRARNRPSTKAIQLSTARRKKDNVARPPAITEAVLEHQSICYFLATHTARNRHVGFLDALPALYKTQADLQLPCLNASVEALALASFAHFTRQGQTAVVARRRYADALKFMNATLADKKDSMSDTTLFSINLLSMYETMTAEDEESLDLTKRHWEGALSLVEAKGSGQLASPFARRNFVQVVTTAIQGGLKIPPAVMDMCRMMIKMLGASDPSLNLWRLVLDTYELGNDLETARDGFGLLLVRASAIDEGFVKIAHEPPESWKYSICFDRSRDDIIYRGLYHVFPNLGIASIWHVIWITRMRVQGHIRTILLSDQARLTPSIDESTCKRQSALCFERGREMSELVLAGTPQFLGYVERIDQSTTPSPNVELDAFDEVKSPESPRSEESEPDAPASPIITHFLRQSPVIKPYAGYMIKSAIQNAMLSSFASPGAKRFAASTLRTVGHTMGVGQALVLARILERLSTYSPG